MIAFLYRAIIRLIGAGSASSRLALSCRSALTAAGIAREGRVHRTSSEDIPCTHSYALSLTKRFGDEENASPTFEVSPPLPPLPHPTPLMDWSRNRPPFCLLYFLYFSESFAELRFLAEGAGLTSFARKSRYLARLLNTAVRILQCNNSITN